MWLCVTVCGSVWLCVVVSVRQGGVHGHPKAWAGMPGVWLWGSGSVLGIFLGPFPTHDHIGLPPLRPFPHSVPTPNKPTLTLNLAILPYAACLVGNVCGPLWSTWGGFSRGGSIWGQSRDRSHNSSTPGMRQGRAGQTLPLWVAVCHSVTVCVGCA